MQVKVCTKCKLPKTLEGFRDRLDSLDKKQYWCRECERAGGRGRYVKREKRPAVDIQPKPYDSAAAKRRMLKSRYGISYQEYESMYTRQAGKCAICTNTLPLGGYRGLYVDHCHSTNVIRGLLCPRCNSGIGSFEDSIEMLQKAIEYLKPYQHAV